MSSVASGRETTAGVDMAALAGSASLEDANKKATYTIRLVRVGEGWDEGCEKGINQEQRDSAISLTDPAGPYM